jgi:ferredoxin
MAEEKKGHVKVTMEVEINEALMDVVKEAIKNMPQMAHMWQKTREQ